MKCRVIISVSIFAKTHQISARYFADVNKMKQKIDNDDIGFLILVTVFTVAFMLMLILGPFGKRNGGWLLDGEICSKDRECQSGSCVNGVCSSSNTPASVTENATNTLRLGNNLLTAAGKKNVEKTPVKEKKNVTKETAIKMKRKVPIDFPIYEKSDGNQKEHFNFGTPHPPKKYIRREFEDFIHSDATEKSISSANMTGISETLNLLSDRSTVPNYSHDLLSPLEQQFAEKPFLSSSGGSKYPNSNFVSKDCPKVIDIINFSTALIYLYGDGKVQLDEKMVGVSIKSERGEKILSKIDLFAVFAGNLLALVGRKVYALNMDSYESNIWKFDEITTELKKKIKNSKYPDFKEFPDFGKILHVSTTLDNEGLAMQFGDGILMINSSYELVQVQPLKPEYRRVYGRYVDVYIDINGVNKTAVTSSGKKIKGIMDAVLTYDGDLIVLSVEKALRNNFRAVKLVNWKPYYLLC